MAAPKPDDTNIPTVALSPAREGQRMVIYQAPPGTAEHDSLVLLAMTTEGVGAP
ncbi:hypothetical protein K1Y78_42555 [Streptomyces sp. tea 10]|nr:hypothetical protein [Streptomyces sp. tea 10]